MRKKEKKQSSPTLAIVYLIAAIALTIYIFVAYAPYLVVCNAEFDSVKKEVDKHQGKNVTIRITGVIDNYAETKHLFLCIPIGVDQHFAVITADNDIVAIKTNDKEKIAELKKGFDQTWALIWGDTDKTPDIISFKGVVIKNEKSVEAYFVDDVTYMEFIPEYGYNICNAAIDNSVSWIDIIVNIVFCILVDTACIAHLIHTIKVKEY